MTRHQAAVTGLLVSLGAAALAAGRRRGRDDDDGEEAGTEMVEVPIRG